MLSHRILVPEIMDDPAIATEPLYGALAGLRRLNFVSNSARIVWEPIRRLARTFSLRRLRILDIATGSGDIPTALWRRARRAGLELEIVGVDMNQRSVELAREQAREAKAAVTFECLNVLTDETPPGFDVVMCSLFLHHLNEQNAVLLLTKMAAAARRLGLVSDLRRSSYGLFLAYTASRLLSRSRIVHLDATQSVRAAFTTKELGQLASQAGICRYEIQHQWPCRMRLCWNTAQTASIAPEIHGPLLPEASGSC